MKIVKHRNLMGLFFAIFMMLPMIAIGVRCAYITFNKNAKDSYYGETINERIETFVSIDDLQFNQNYLYKQIAYTDTVIGGTTTVNISDLVWLEGTYYSSGTPTFDISETDFILIYIPTNPRLSLEFHKRNENGYYQVEALNNYISFSYTFLGFPNPSSTNLNYFNNNYLVTYNKYSYLDNAFIYSVHEITDNNLGKIDFFTFFSNMFLDLNNPKTQIYVNFVNWYFNYMLLVSLAYLLFFVIMWFINYIRQILERGNSLGHGGF